ncbi:MAG: sugar phosphate isomerase/epimerase [Acidobacteria bacterium]|nr:sugar phosphate isomerase/epimerase [Acidobacteriota bacterium]
MILMLCRRATIESLFAMAASPASASAPSMTLSMHQFTSAGAGYQKSLEGWAKAGIKQVEPAAQQLDNFLKQHSLADAKRILTDNGLTVVSGAIGTMGLWEPNPNFNRNLDEFKRRCEQFAFLGAPVVYSPGVTAARFTLDDYKASPAQIRKVADTAAQFKIKVCAEFVRSSTFMASLPTALQLHRAAAHPSFGILFDTYHFFSGPSKIEDLEMIRPGEILHAHINDTPAIPRELLDLQSRLAPGDGIAPLKSILSKLASKGYQGPISVELFLPMYQQADPFTLATELMHKTKPILDL